MSRAAINEAQYDAGWADAWLSYDPEAPVGDPVGDEDYNLGWWVGIGDVQAWNEGYEAGKAGLHACRFVAPEDAEWRALWLIGYGTAMAVDEEVRHAC